MPRISSGRTAVDTALELAQLRLRRLPRAVCSLPARCAGHHQCSDALPLRCQRLGRQRMQEARAGHIPRDV